MSSVNNSRKRPRSKISRSSGSAFPLSRNLTQRVDHVFRFQAVSAATHNLTVPDMKDLVCFATGATAAYQLYKAFKLRKIEMWGPPASSLSPVTVSLQYSGVGDTAGPSFIHSDTSVGTNRVAHICAKVPSLSRAALWQSSQSADILCSLTFPAGAIIDVHVAYAINDTAETPQTVGGAVAGATVGQVYVRALTSNTSTTILAPLSVATI